MFLNTYSMPGTRSLPSFNHPSSLGNIVGLIFTEETIRFEFNDLLKTTQLETFKPGEVAYFLSPKYIFICVFRLLSALGILPVFLCPSPFLISYCPRLHQLHGCSFHTYTLGGLGHVFIVCPTVGRDQNQCLVWSAWNRTCT